MSRLEAQSEHPALRPPSNYEIVFDHHVFDYILYELERYPSSEEGGKYIGYLDAAGPNRSKDRACRVVITDFLPGGPRATRTTVEFLPDGQFQEQLFREAERKDKDIEHVGTWHSHHCNGLDRLSGGDINGYFKTVNKPAYRPELFVASLVKRLPRNPRDTTWIDHFLFVRDHDRFYNITGHIAIADSPTKFGDITGHNPEKETRLVRSTIISNAASLWHESETGRQMLAEDKRFFVERFGPNFRAARKHGVIRITCNAGPKFIAVSYPLNVDDRQMTINVGSSSRPILTITCDYADRHLAYSTSLHALEHF